MIRSIGKQCGESVESVLRKKRKATVGRICRKGRFRTASEQDSRGPNVQTPSHGQGHFIAGRRERKCAENNNK